MYKKLSLHNNGVYATFTAYVMIQVRIALEYIKFIPSVV